VFAAEQMFHTGDMILFLSYYYELNYVSESPDRAVLNAESSDAFAAAQIFHTGDIILFLTHTLMLFVHISHL
jgi:hypothetical protein